MTADNTFDIAVLGAGPAGCAAALAAAAGGARVALVGPASFNSYGPWTGPLGVRAIEALGLTFELAGATRFDGVRLTTWDGRRSLTPTAPDLFGWVFDPERVAAQLVRLTERATCVRIAQPVVSIERADAATRIVVGDDTICAAVLIVADGASESCCAQAGFTRLRREGRWRAVFRGWDGAPAGLSMSIGAHTDAPVLVSAYDGAQATVSLHAVGPVEVSRLLLEQGIPRANATQGDSIAAEPNWISDFGVAPAAALEADSHCSKRAILVGENGGFLSALAREAWYPGLESGRLAAHCALQALRSPIPQEALGEFESQWRFALGPYLRLPNADPGLLVPLATSNAFMAERLARAILFGGDS